MFLGGPKASTAFRVAVAIMFRLGDVCRGGSSCSRRRFEVLEVSGRARLRPIAERPIPTPEAHSYIQLISMTDSTHSGCWQRSLRRRGVQACEVKGMLIPLALFACFSQKRPEHPPMHLK